MKSYVLTVKCDEKGPGTEVIDRLIQTAYAVSALPSVHEVKLSNPGRDDIVPQAEQRPGA